MTASDILAIQRCIDLGVLKLVHRKTGWDCGNYHFDVDGALVAFEFFNDAGDWDYLSAVYANGVQIADYKKLNNEAVHYTDEDPWYDVGRWMPTLPPSSELESLDEER